MNDQNPADETAHEFRKALDHHRQCPPADTLVDFHEDQLDPGDASAVAAHLGICTDCARLIEQLADAESPMPVLEDEAYREARDEDRHQVAKALGFRVGRPPSRPLLERLSWLWESRVPAMVPAAVCAMLLAVILLPDRPELPVTVLRSEVELNSTDRQTRSSPEGSSDCQAPVNSSLKVRHIFLNTPVEEGTMVSIDVIGQKDNIHLEPESVVMITENEFERPGIEFTLTFNAPGNYILRLSNPHNTFPPVTLDLEILAN